ncbi:ABC transporter permease [Desulfoluna sp.]|uniref:ABC transporter permease n=1 Tax=Desulfoluna sp. TaxID=2045199 RepID=UPI00261D14A5|nr:ABC transporter permease [Desulfoluna sp.]
MDGAKSLLRVMAREVSAMVSGRLMRLMLLFIPLIGIGLFTALFYQGSPENLPVAVCDMDRSGLSRSIVRMVEATPDMSVMPVPDLAAGRQAILSGTAYGLLVLPEHMERTLLAGGAPASRFYLNNQLMLAAGLLTRSMSEVYSAASTGMKLRVTQAQGVPETRSRERTSGIHINRKVLFNPHLDYRWFLHSSLCPFLMKIFIMCATVWAVGGEIKRQRVDSWLEAAGGNIHLALLGKLLPHTLWFTLMGWGILVLFFGSMDLPKPQDPRALMVGMPLYVMACQSVALLFVAFTGEMAQAASFTSFYASSSFVFAGVTFPSAAMPLAARLWHDVLPLTYVVRLINEQTVRGLAPAQSLGTLGALVWIVVLCGGVAWCRLTFRLSAKNVALTTAGGVA